jgi:hypothetical protein
MAKFKKEISAYQTPVTLIMLIYGYTSIKTLHSHIEVLLGKQNKLPIGYFPSVFHLFWNLICKCFALWVPIRKLHALRVGKHGGYNPLFVILSPNTSLKMYMDSTAV